jgi:hypothetical protein
MIQQQAHERRVREASAVVPPKFGYDTTAPKSAVCPPKPSASTAAGTPMSERLPNGPSGR